MKLTQEHYDKLLIKKIENSNDFNWLKKLLRSKTPFSEVVLDRIKKIHSLEISNLVLKNY